MKNLTVMLVIALLFSFGCAKQQSVREEPLEEDIIFEEFSETTEIPEITFTEETKTTPSTEEKKITEKETSIFEEKEPTTKEVPKTTKKHGFRVQIGAYNTKASAEKIANRARTILKERVYIEYIMPYYKVRVGNFINRASADHCKVNLRRRGYRGAFIVETEIITE